MPFPLKDESWYGSWKCLTKPDFRRTFQILGRWELVVWWTHLVTQLLQQTSRQLGELRSKYVWYWPFNQLTCSKQTQWPVGMRPWFRLLCVKYTVVFTSSWGGTRAIHCQNLTKCVKDILFPLKWWSLCLAFQNYSPQHQPETMKCVLAVVCLSDELYSAGLMLQSDIETKTWTEVCLLFSMSVCLRSLSK